MHSSPQPTVSYKPPTSPVADADQEKGATQSYQAVSLSNRGNNPGNGKLRLKSLSQIQYLIGWDPERPFLEASWNEVLVLAVSAGLGHNDFGLQ
jgi:hypothetical protein